MKRGTWKILWGAPNQEWENRTKTSSPSCSLQRGILLLCFLGGSYCTNSAEVCQVWWEEEKWWSCDDVEGDSDGDQAPRSPWDAVEPSEGIKRFLLVNIEKVSFLDIALLMGSTRILMILKQIMIIKIMPFLDPLLYITTESRGIKRDDPHQSPKADMDELCWERFSFSKGSTGYEDDEAEEEARSPWPSSTMLQLKTWDSQVQGNVEAEAQVPPI